MDNQFTITKTISEDEVAPILSIMKFPPLRERTVSSISLSSSGTFPTTASPTIATKKNVNAKKKKTTSLPNETVEYLKAWMMSPEHIAHPYPTEVEKAQIMQDTGIELKQLTNWFVNNRKRYWKPRVEARLREQQLHKNASTHPPIIKRDGSVLSLEDLATNMRGTTSSSSSSVSLSSSPVRSTKRRVSDAAATTAAVTPVAVSKPTASVDNRASHTVSPLPGSPSRTFVSEQSSVGSSTDSSSSEDEDDVYVQRPVPVVQVTPVKSTTTTETIDIHILKPTGALPELSDVTVLKNIPKERVLRSFQNCAITYQTADPKKMHSRRDAEIVRVKKHYLAVYLAKAALRSARQEKVATRLTDSSCSSSSDNGRVERKRPTTDNHQDDDIIAITPRRKYRRVSVELWKDACQTAEHVYDDQRLPSLEEAARLFGYASN